MMPGLVLSRVYGLAEEFAASHRESGWENALIGIFLSLTFACADVIIK